MPNATAVRIQRATVVLNQSSGLTREGISAERLRSAFRNAGVREVDVVELRRTLNLRAAIESRVRASMEAVVAAGGDGTVSAVAGVLARTEIPFGVIPAGTLNHFARDLSIPLDIDQAVQVIAAGETQTVDAASVNGRVFVNNSSIGIYPAMVRVREQWMARGLPKHAAMALGAFAALWQFPNVSVRLTTNSGGLAVRTPVVFVGNNHYHLSGLDAGARPGVQDGVLQVCTVRGATRLSLIRMLLLTAAGFTESVPELYIESVHEARIDTLRRHVRVALDGEVVRLRTPLIYSALPGALRVLAPSQ